MKADKKNKRITVLFKIITFSILLFSGSVLAAQVLVAFDTQTFIKRSISKDMIICPYSCVIALCVGVLLISVFTIVGLYDFERLEQSEL